MRFFIFSFAILYFQFISAQENIDLSKFKGSIEMSVFPIHKASLLGLTSTESPTFGIGFIGSYAKWSFYSITFHEINKLGIVLSQSESNLNYKIIENNRLKVSVFNTFITRADNSALYMIPTVSIGVGKSKNLYFDLTPYTWGFNTDVKGYTYSALYNFDKKLNNNLNLGFLSKLVYTDLQPVYKGVIADFSPFLKWKSYKIQSRFIYQFSSQRFIYDLSFRKTIKL